MRIARLREAESPFTNGEIELDESRFGARGVRRERWRVARGKLPVLGIPERGDGVYAPLARSRSAGEPTPVLKGKADADAAVYSDGFGARAGAASYGYKKRHGVGRGENAFANGADRIDGIESFRGLREVISAKLRGVRERTFHSRVNERELSDSCGNENIYLTLPGSFRKAPLKLSRTLIYHILL
ncbi:MAG: IS1595 family transposase [Prevotellaceae bacterium]|nr:IS1595 family transposase [Prevotellaceae bacterium]